MINTKYNIEYLQQIQINLSKELILSDTINSVKTIGGINITLADRYNTPTKGWAGIVVIDAKTLEPVYEKVIEGTIEFPYYSGLLAFREMSLLIKLYEKLEMKPDIFMINGHGYSHPRKLGIASHFGVETGEVTIGITKRLYFGTVKSFKRNNDTLIPIVNSKDCIGMAYRISSEHDPIYISIGNKISLGSAVELVNHTCIQMIPEPIRLAHKLLRPIRKHITGKY